MLQQILQNSNSLSDATRLAWFTKIINLIYSINLLYQTPAYLSFVGPVPQFLEYKLNSALASKILCASTLGRYLWLVDSFYPNTFIFFEFFKGCSVPLVISVSQLQNFPIPRNPITHLSIGASITVPNITHALNQLITSTSFIWVYGRPDTEAALLFVNLKLSALLLSHFHMHILFLSLSKITIAHLRG